MSNNLTRQELPPEDLGDLTAVPERGAGLAGLIDDDIAPAAPVSRQVCGGRRSGTCSASDHGCAGPIRVDQCPRFAGLAGLVLGRSRQVRCM